MAAINLVKSTLHLGTGPLIRANPYRCLWTFKRVRTPPLPKPRESPYIVGPYLKPSYLPTEYITDPISEDNTDDDDYRLYKAESKDTNIPRIKLLLLSDTPGLGLKGQVVRTKPSNHILIAMGKAVYATEFTEKWFKSDHIDAPSAMNATMLAVIGRLEKTTFRLPLAEGVQVEPWHIPLAMRLGGVHCPLEAVKFDTFKRYKEGDKEYAKCTLLINGIQEVTTKFVFPSETGPAEESLSQFVEGEDEDED